VRIGFIGAGIISDLHAEAIAACPGAELAGLWSRSPERAAGKARAFGCRAYPSAEELVRDPGIDAIFVLTNLETHCHYSSLALAAGKHVLVEKPVGVEVAEVLRLQETAGRAGLVCMPGHNYIYEDSLIRTRDLIRQGKLGRLVSVYVLYNIHHPELVAARYPGVIRQIMTHHAYILLFLAGRPSRVSAMKATLHYQTATQEDLAMVTLQLDSGALAHFCASFAADDHAADPWTVLVKCIGTEGSARYSYRDWVELRPGAVHSQTYSAYPGSIVNEVRYFVERCVRGGEPPRSTLQDAADAQRIVDACERAAERLEVVPVEYR
jgi:predicted dehydrogenase